MHVAALLAADTALVFSLLASLLYLLQERRLKDKAAPGFFRLAAASRYDGAHSAVHARARLPVHDAGSLRRLADRTGAGRCNLL